MKSHVRNWGSVTFLVMACLFLSGCGFQLRGSANVPFKSVFIEINYVSSIAAELKRNLEALTNVKVVDVKQDAEAIITNFGEVRNKQILSINTAGRVREFRLQLTVNFSVIDQQGKVLIPLTTLPIERDFSFNDAAVLAKENEEALLYRDMQSDLVQQIVRRLSLIKRDPKPAE